MEPIWKDYYVDFTPYFEDGAQFVDYTIEINGSAIYTGRAYKAPAGDTLVRINDICADYLGHMDLRTIFPGGGILPIDLTDTAAMRMFRVMVDSEMVDEVEFFNCWDYTHNGLVTGEKLSATISNEYVTGMPLVRTAFAVGRPVFNPVIMHYPFVDISYKRVECCNPAVLYFYNAQCGWDFLLCKGGAKRVDSFTRATTKREYNNGSNERGTYNYQNTAKVEWDVMTGWIPNAGSKNMWQLLGSTDVWLWTPDVGLLPVIINTNSVDEKDYKLNGRKPVEYTIRVELAQDRQRR